MILVYGLIAFLLGQLLRDVSFDVDGAPGVWLWVLAVALVAVGFSLCCWGAGALLVAALS